MKNLPKILAFATLLFMYLPFLDGCSENPDLSIKNSETVSDKKEFIMNVYQVSAISIKGIWELNFRDQHVVFFIATLCMSFCTLLVVIVSFTRKYRLFFYLNVITFSFLVISAVSSIGSKLVVYPLNQFKIGFYLLAINFILLIIVSRTQWIKFKKITPLS